jgi:hypothetical protein
MLVRPECIMPVLLSEVCSSTLAKCRLQKMYILERKTLSHIPSGITKTDVHTYKVKTRYHRQMVAPHFVLI